MTTPSAAANHDAPLGAVSWAMRRELRIAVRSPASAVLALVFFLLSAAMFPLGVGPEPARLRDIAPGIVWASAVLATLPPLLRLFEADHGAGALDAFLLSGRPLPALVAGKAIAHGLIVGVPITAAAPLVGIWFGLDPDAIPVLLASLSLGLPTLTLLGAACAGLTLGADAGRGGGMALLALLLLPLAVPVLILGSGAVEAAATGQPAVAHLALLAALLIGTVVGAPFAMASAVRIAAE